MPGGCGCWRRTGSLGFASLAAFVASFAVAGVARRQATARNLGLLATAALALALVTSEFHLKGLFFVAAGVAAVVEVRSRPSRAWPRSSRRPLVIRRGSGAHRGHAVMQVPFFRVAIGDAEIAEVVDTLKSGWLTTGPKTQRFEEEFAAAVGATHAVALNSCTAALHLAVEALGLRAGDGVLVPTMTFAATAEVVRYLGAVPILVDCEPDTCNLDVGHAEQLLADCARGHFPPGVTAATRIVGVMPVHYGGYLADVAALRALAARHGLWVVEDAAHAFPAAWRAAPDAAWQQCGAGTADVTCFSFYANKTITTGEGGMAVTNSPALAARMKQMSLHGLSRDAWGRYAGGGSWDYQILAPGYKYNLTDIASAIGLHQLRRAEAMRAAPPGARRPGTTRACRRAAEPRRRRPARRGSMPGISIPSNCASTHLPVTRNQVMDGLRARGVTASVHWRPLHLHPYYQERFGYAAAACPVATAAFDRLLSLPLFPDLTRRRGRLRGHHAAPGVRRAAMKRLVDCVVAALGLVLLAPVLALVALLIKLDSRGPVLFRQTRVGRHFRPFLIYKFRTMCRDAEARGPQVTSAGDRRVTRVGHWLRLTKVDELPQLFNVLIGDMSLVGPRPEVPRYVELFRDDFAAILAVRPGVTDLASLKYRHEALLLARAGGSEAAYLKDILPEKIRLARFYVKQASPAYDLMVLARTLVSLFAPAPEAAR